MIIADASGLEPVTRMRLKTLFILAGLWFAACAPAEPPAFDGQRAFSDVETQVAFGPRVPGTDGHRRCGDWLATQLRATTPEVRRQSFFHSPPRVSPGSDALDTFPMWNLIASFNTESPDRIMICAHWDSRPWADQDPDTANYDQPVPGANDGGSGVAVCLEMARMMAQLAPPFGVDIVLFDGEDQGPQGQLGEYLIGSRWFVNQARGYRPAAVLLLDMVGDRDLGLPRERFSDSLAPELNDLVWQTAARLGLPAFIDTVAGAIVDDHLPFLLNRVAAVDIIDFEYDYWHTVEDTPDKVAPESLEQIGRLLTELVYRTPIEAFRAASRVAAPGR